MLFRSYTHVLPEDFKDTRVKILKITAKVQDYKKMAELYVCKAWPALWTPEEYSKWASNQYPPYSTDNIPESKLIVNDLVTDFEHSIIGAWYQRYCNSRSDYVIDFRTIMGLDSNDLVQSVSNIVGNFASADTKSYVRQYQQLNQSLYFRDYQ